MKSVTLILSIKPVRRSGYRIWWMKGYGVVLFILLLATVCPHAQVKIGSGDESAPHTSSMLEVEASDKGLLPPRVADPALIADPAPGLMIYNSTINCMQYYNGVSWVCIGCQAPVHSSGISGSEAPLSGSNYVYSISGVSDADAYTWSVPEGYSILSGQGSPTITVQIGTGLGQIVVVPSNPCGQTFPPALSVEPYQCGTSVITLSHAPSDGVSPVTKSAVYGSVTHQGLCWADRNLGADQVATGPADNTLASGGWHWQFNRKQGILHTSSNNNTPSWPVTSIDENNNWIAANDPCHLLLGVDWRIPTGAELLQLEDGWENYNHAYASPLKMHAAGRVFTGGNSDNARGLYGLYWSSSQGTSTTGANIDFGPTFSYPGAWSKASGASVRCARN